MNTPVCEREHHYDIRLSDLPDNQAATTGINAVVVLMIRDSMMGLVLDK